MTEREDSYDVSEVAGRRPEEPSYFRPLVMLAIVLWLAVTNSTLFGPAEGDGISYRVMSEAAPGLPDEAVATAYSGRWIPHYLVGLIGQIPGVSLSAAYAIGLLLVLGALVVVLLRLLRSASIVTFSLAAGLALLSPYAVRPYLINAWTYQDLVFVLGTAVCLLGLLRKAPILTVVGLLIAIAGRQSALPLIAVAAMWIAIEPQWRGKFGASRFAWAGALLVTAVAAYAAIGSWVAPFSEDFEPHIPEDTILPLLLDLPSRASDLGAHFARTAVPLLVPLAALLAVVLRRRERKLSLLTWQAFGCLVLAAAVIAQPAAISPDFPGFAYNEQRLAALGLIPLVVGLAVLLEPVMSRQVSRAALVPLALLLLAGSLHHLFTWFGPPTTGLFLVCQVVVAAGVGIVTWVITRPAADASARGRSDEALGSPADRP